MVFRITASPHVQVCSYSIIITHVQMVRSRHIYLILLLFVSWQTLATVPDDPSGFAIITCQNDRKRGMIMNPFTGWIDDKKVMEKGQFSWGTPLSE